MNPTDRSLIAIFAAVVHHPARAEQALVEARVNDAEAEKLLELLLMTHLFAGIPRLINALESFRRHVGSATEDEEPRRLASDDIDAVRRRGAAMFETIYGENTRRVLDDLDRFHPEIRDWILVFAYGLVLSRPGLDARTRELAAVAALVVSGDRRQLLSHERGARRLGASDAEIEAARAIGEAERRIPITEPGASP